MTHAVTALIDLSALTTEEVTDLVLSLAFLLVIFLAPLSYLAWVYAGLDRAVKHARAEENSTLDEVPAYAENLLGAVQHLRGLGMPTDRVYRDDGTED